MLNTIASHAVGNIAVRTLKSESGRARIAPPMKKPASMASVSFCLPNNFERFGSSFGIEEFGLQAPMLLPSIDEWSNGEKNRAFTLTGSFTDERCELITLNVG
jgi:hypothetical protein